MVYKKIQTTTIFKRYRKPQQKYKDKTFKYLKHAEVGA